MGHVLDFLRSNEAQRAPLLNQDRTYTCFPLPLPRRAKYGFPWLTSWAEQVVGAPRLGRGALVDGVQSNCTTLSTRSSTASP